MEAASPYTEGAQEEDTIYPCKGCGEILEEGKAFELAGNRWHIDCFRCNTCGTLLDSDANLLLLGDGSLICNNCTYSCSACNNKIEDLAILTGDQAFCANCFRCRNCKRKIDNLRYARTSQGIFCMSCHESLMARRRKNKKANRTPTPASNGINKSLPELPPSLAAQNAFASTPTMDVPGSEKLTDSVYSDTVPSARNSKVKKETDKPPTSRDLSPPTMDESSMTTADDQILLPASTFQGTTTIDNRPPSNSKTLSYADNGADIFGSVPFMLDPKDTISKASPPPTRGTDISDASRPESKTDSRGVSKDYFGRTMPLSSATRESLQESSRSSSVERSRAASPHIAHQEKEVRKPSGHITDAMRRRPDEPTQSTSSITSPVSHSTPAVSQSSPVEGDSFKLQEAPKHRTSRRSSKGESRTPATLTPAATPRVDQPLVDESPLLKGRISYVSDDYLSPDLTMSSHSKEVERPKRGDSLAATGMKPVPRKEVGSAGPTTPVVPPLSATTHERKVSQAGGVTNGSRSVLTMPATPPRGLSDPPPRAPSRPGVPKSGSNDIFTTPRAAPPAPSSGSRHGPTASTSTVHSDLSNPHRSPALPRGSTGAEFSMEEELERIMRGEDKGEGGMFRKVSNAVKHGRSFSDRAPRSERSSTQKWPRSPRNNGSMEISSPTSASSPSAHEENILLKNRLRQAQDRVARLEMEKNNLQTLFSNNVDMSQVNTELKEKRSTMAFLDTQRELVVRELEVMTEHLRRAKDSNQALDVNELKSNVSRDFAASLQKLKDTLGKQVEELVQRRNDLTREIDDLIQMKDKGFTEYESLSSRNLQLTQHNNELIASIQSNMKANAHHNGAGSFDGRRDMANGLGLYIQQNNKGPRSQEPNDLREVLTTGSTEFSQGTLVNSENDNDSVVAMPQVVKIGKASKPNMLKKGTQGFVKGLRNMRGQLSERNDRIVGPGDRSNSIPYALEGTPYNAMPQIMDANNPMGQRAGVDAAGRQKFSGLFGDRNDKTHLKHLRGGLNGSNSNLVGDAALGANQLFGSDLAARCDYEKRVIPCIVSRCIEEVELRGMDVEGIYRKSGGTGQVNIIRGGFEKDNDYDISDPDLDIHAVTSTLKQYFRKLPTPLITYDVYDKLLDCARIEDKESRAPMMKEAINSLPKSHRDCVEFLIFHLAKVMAQEKDNLMTPLNLAVVFAPTIMRPTTIEREMTDMQLQRIAVQSILEMNQIIFGYDS